jgi:hypothetical protein
VTNQGLFARIERVEVAGILKKQNQVLGIITRFLGEGCIVQTSKQSFISSENLSKLFFSTN